MGVKSFVKPSIVRVINKLRPKPNTETILIFGNYKNIKRELIALSEPAYRELSVALDKCRSFFHDLLVFQQVEHELNYLDYLTDNRKMSLDIGANIGLYAALLSPHSSCVIAWEANPHLLPYLAINLQRYKNVRVLPFAASKDFGDAVFNIPVAADGSLLSHSGSGGLTNTLISKLGIQSVAVPVMMFPVDAFKFKNVGYVKIDVEGSEHAVLEGARETIDRERPCIVIENEYRHNSECGKVFEFLLQRNYNGYFVERDTKILKPFSDFSMQKNQTDLLDTTSNITNFDRYVNNFMFVPSEADKLKALLK